MTRDCFLDHCEIKYVYKKSRRARCLKLSVAGDATVTVTVPYFLNRWMADKFIDQKKEWIIKTVKRIRQKTIRIENIKDYASSKSAARQFILHRISYFNQFLKVEINRVLIKRQKKIWGSCSQNKNLNFNYRVLFLPPEVADYIVVHEMCHLKEMNHSAGL